MMEEQDLNIIERLIPRDKELARLWDEHLAFERRLEEMAKRPYLSPDEEIEAKRLKKLKLVGRDRIEEILAAHRAE